MNFEQPRIGQRRERGILSAADRFDKSGNKNDRLPVFVIANIVAQMLLLILKELVQPIRPATDAANVQRDGICHRTREMAVNESPTGNGLGMRWKWRDHLAVRGRC